MLSSSPLVAQRRDDAVRRPRRRRAATRAGSGSGAGRWRCRRRRAAGRSWTLCGLSETSASLNDGGCGSGSSSNARRMARRRLRGALAVVGRLRARVGAARVRRQVGDPEEERLRLGRAAVDEVDRLLGVDVGRVLVRGRPVVDERSRSRSAGSRSTGRCASSRATRSTPAGSCSGRPRSRSGTCRCGRCSSRPAAARRRACCCCRATGSRRRPRCWTSRRGCARTGR